MPGEGKKESLMDISLPKAQQIISLKKEKKEKTKVFLCS